MLLTLCLVGVGQASHATHYAKHVVVGGIHSDLSSLRPFHRGIRQDQLQCGVINAGEVACAGRLVFLGAQSEGVHVDALIGVAGVGLVRLDPREVGALTLGEAVLSVELQLGSHNGVHAPAVHGQRCLGQHKGSGVRHRGAVQVGLVGKSLEVGHGLGVKSRVGKVIGHVSHTAKVGLVVGIVGARPVTSLSGLEGVVQGTGVLEQALLVDELVSGASDGLGSTERVDSVGQSVNGVGVVEGLGTKHLEQDTVAHKGRAVVDVLVGLHNPDKLLDGVVEVELNLVAGRTNRLVTSELQLTDEVLMGLLGKSASLVGVKEDIVDVEGSGNQRLVVSDGGGHRGSSLEVGGNSVDCARATEGGHGPQALVDGTDIKVNLDLVVLQSNKRQSQTRVGAKPKLEGHVEGGLRKSIAGSAHLAGSQRVARSIHLGERGVCDKGELSGVSNHLEVSALLLGGHCQLVPDMHPVTILTIDTLSSNFHLNLGDQLLTREVQPAGVDTTTQGGRRDTHKLVNLGESNLQVGAVSQITIAADGALHAATEVSLTIEGLLNALNSKVGVSAVSDLPESNLGVRGQVNILGAIGDDLKKSSGHFVILSSSNIIFFEKTIQYIIYQGKPKK